MNEPEKHALARVLQNPSGRTILTFLHELAINEAVSATRSTDRDTAFAHSQRAAGLLEAHAQLEALTTGDYVRTELRHDANG